MIELFENSRVRKSEDLTEMSVGQKTSRIRIHDKGLEKTGLVTKEAQVLLGKAGAGTFDSEGQDVSGKALLLLVDPKNENHYKGYQVAVDGSFADTRGIDRIGEALGVGSGIAEQYETEPHGLDAKNRTMYRTVFNPDGTPKLKGGKEGRREFLNDFVVRISDSPIMLQDKAGNFSIKAWKLELASQTPPKNDRVISGKDESDTPGKDDQAGDEPEALLDVRGQY